jgi:spore coat polysaccharide biosynthesis protein SpsF
VKTVVIVQARVGSSRLPRKVLLNLGGMTVLGRVLERLRWCHRVNDVVVATTDQPNDQAIVEEAHRCGVKSIRGSEHDVLSRFYLAATHSRADVIIRITSDCPLVDPMLIDQMVAEFHRSHALGQGVDYLSNTHPRTFPHGLDTEIFTMSGLETANREASEGYEREHVTPYFYLNPQRFRLENYEQATDLSALRWTLDEPADQQFFAAIFRHFDPTEMITTDQVLALLKRFPELSQINAHVQQKSLRAA